MCMFLFITINMDDINIPRVSVETESGFEDEFHIIREFVMQLIVALESTLFKISFTIHQEWKEVLLTENALNSIRPLIDQYFDIPNVELYERVQKMQKINGLDDEKNLEILKHWLKIVYDSLDRSQFQILDQEITVESIQDTENPVMRTYLASIEEQAEEYCYFYKEEIVRYCFDNQK